MCPRMVKRGGDMCIVGQRIHDGPTPNATTPAKAATTETKKA